MAQISENTREVSGQTNEIGAAEAVPAFEEGMDENGQELSVEQAFAELEKLVKRMESDDISLEESFSCYEKGIRLVRFCNDRIDRVEKKVQMLRGEGMTGDGSLM